MLNGGNARRRGTCGTFWWSDPVRKISPTHPHNSGMLKCGGLCATQKNTQRLKIARYQIVGNPLKRVELVLETGEAAEMTVQHLGGFQGGMKNRARIPRPRSRIGTSEPGAWFTLKRGFYFFHCEAMRIV